MRGRARFGGFVVAAVLAGSVGACTAVAPAPPTSPVPSPAGTSGRSCAPAAVRSCALPYPSDQWTVPDASTPTGLRLDLPADLIPASVQSALGPGARLEDVQAGADGFSAVGPVVFELDRPVDPASLPADGGDVVRVFDRSTGDPVPLRVELTPDSIRQGAPDTIVMAWPRIRWEPGHTYVARLAEGLTGPQGTPARPAGMDGATGNGGPFISSVRADLARIEGDRWNATLEATRFTVRSTGTATASMDSMVSAARGADHPVRDLAVGPALLTPSGSAVVRGEVQLSDFRDSNGVVRPDRPPQGTWVPFVMVLPARPASSDGAPVVVYGHGLTAAKETLLVVAEANAAHGMATIGIDVPNHGDRQAGQGGYLLDITTPGTLGRLVSMPLQGEVDTVSLFRAITSHMADLDLAGTGSTGWTAPDGRPDLDTSRLLYEGTSMGGVLGAASITQIPELDGAYLQVPGSGIADILYHSQLWVLFAGVIPWGASAGDAAALRGLATLLLDPAENAYLAERLRDGSPPLFVQYGVGDGVVPNPSTERLAALADLPFVGKEIAPLGLDLRRAGTDVVPADGRGIAQVYPLHSSTEMAAFMAHLSFTEPAADVVLDQWLANRSQALGLGAG